MATKTPSSMHSPFAKEPKRASTASSSLHNPFSKGPEPKSPKVLHKINVGRSANGGFEMQHQFSNFDHAPETQQAPDGHGMLTHIAKHMGIHDVDIQRKAAAQAEEKSEPPAERAREAAMPGAETAEEAGGDY